MIDTLGEDLTGESCLVVFPESAKRGNAETDKALAGAAMWQAINPRNGRRLRHKRSGQQYHATGLQGPFTLSELSQKVREVLAGPMGTDA